MAVTTEATENDKIRKVAFRLKDWAERGKYGEVTVQFQAGKIVGTRESQTFRPEKDY